MVCIEVVNHIKDTNIWHRRQIIFLKFSCGGHVNDLLCIK